MAAMTLRRHLAALALLLGSCAPAPERVVEQDLAIAPPTRDPAELRRVMLTAHNRARAAAGVPSLAWSPALAESAAAYAEAVREALRRAT